MPEIDDEDQSSLLAVMPGLMLETIIENIGFSLLLLTSLVTYTHTTAFHAHQRQVEP